MKYWVVNLGLGQEDSGSISFLHKPNILPVDGKSEKAADLKKHLKVF
jgi:hypothetical protein